MAEYVGHKICPCGEMDITTDFGSVILGSSPGGGTEFKYSREYLLYFCLDIAEVSKQFDFTRGLESPGCLVRSVSECA